MMRVYRRKLKVQIFFFQLLCGCNCGEMIELMLQTRQQGNQVTTYLGGCCGEKEVASGMGKYTGGE